MLQRSYRKDDHISAPLILNLGAVASLSRTKARSLIYRVLPDFSFLPARGFSFLSKGAYTKGRNPKPSILLWRSVSSKPYRRPLPFSSIITPTRVSFDNTL